MNQEAMRAIVLIGQHISSSDGLGEAELEELAFLCLILRRASRAQEGVEIGVLEARALGNALADEWSDRPRLGGPGRVFPAEE